MSRVLLLCPEPLGHGQPAGIGIRFLEIERVLRADGHEVTLLSAPIAAADILQHSHNADVAVVQGHIANDFFAHALPIPTVVDLYDPFIVENLHYYESRGSEVFTHDHATLVNSLLRGDFFLCASDAQRLFWLGMLLAVGRLNPATFESSLQPNVHVIGDAAIAGAMPKSAFAANAQAKVCAAAIAILLAGGTPPTPKLINTCYSLVAPDYGISIAGVYQLANGQLAEVAGSGGVSPLDAAAATRNEEALYAEGWFRTLTAEVFG